MTYGQQTCVSFVNLNGGTALWAGEADQHNMNVLLCLNLWPGAGHRQVLGLDDWQFALVV